METVVFRHGISRGADSFGPVLDRAGIKWRVVETWHEDISGFDARAPELLIVMGGAPGTYQTKEYPYLAQEIKIIEKRLAKDLPVLGICLGAQLMASALGARGYKGPQGPETGWFPLKVNEAGMKTPLEHLDAAHTKIVQWHQDTFDFPQGATLLASSDLYENQVFSYGRNALAIQGHPEATPSSFENRLVGASNAVAAGKLDLTKLRREAKEYLPALTRQTDKFLTAWLALVMGKNEELRRA